MPLRLEAVSGMLPQGGEQPLKREGWGPSFRPGILLAMTCHIKAQEARIRADGA